MREQRRNGMTEEEELIWAKLNGDWSNANYRFEVAKAGKCLRILSHDENRAVQRIAHDQWTKQIFSNIKKKYNIDIGDDGEYIL